MADCARIKPANQQDAARRSLTHTRGRRYRLTEYKKQVHTSLDVTSTTQVPDGTSAKIEITIQYKEKMLEEL